MKERYIRNKELITEEEQKKLGESTVAIVGLGGLGGHIAEQLSRLGIGKLILIDSDKVSESNLNRQLFATEKSVGEYKTHAAKERLMIVNSNVEYVCYKEFLTEENAETLLSNTDIVVDAVDNVHSRLLLQRICKKMNIPLVHGSIGGWYGQVCTILPGDDTLNLIYPDEKTVGVEKKLGNPAFTPAIVASIEVAEVLKYLLQEGELLRNKMLYIDLLMHDYIIIKLA